MRLAQIPYIKRESVHIKGKYSLVKLYVTFINRLIYRSVYQLKIYTTFVESLGYFKFANIRTHEDETFPCSFLMGHAKL